MAKIKVYKRNFVEKEDSKAKSGKIINIYENLLYFHIEPEPSEGGWTKSIAGESARALL